MTWFQRMQLPDRFKDMSPEQIEAEFKKLESQPPPDPAPAPKVEDSDAYKTLQAQFEQTKQELEGLKVQPPNQPPVNPDQPPQLTSFLEDEDRAFQERATPLVNMTLQNTSLMARQIAEQDLRDELDPTMKASNRYVMSNYKQEIDQLYNSMPLQAKVSPDAFKNVVGVVKHRHFSDVFKAVSNPVTGLEGAGGGGQPPSEPNPNEPPEKQLTPGELRVAQRMRLTPAQYLEAKKKMRIATETTGYAEVKVG